MADLNLIGIDMNTGQMRAVDSSDTIVNSDNQPLLGMTGVRGASGLSGSTGLQGSQGASGILGATGIRGVTGFRGITGLSNVQGVSGLIGGTGVTIGTTGIRGVTGIQGFGVYALLTGSTTLTASVRVVGCDSSGGSFAVTLPSAATVGAGKEYFIYDVTGNVGANNVTVQRTGADTFNGQTSYSLDTNYELVKFYSNGTNYFYRIVKGTTGLQGATGLFSDVQGATGISGATGV